MSQSPSPTKRQTPQMIPVPDSLDPEMLVADTALAQVDEPRDPADITGSRSLIGQIEATAKVDVTLHSMMGGYRIERLLGEGAMGKVYLARHEMLDRPAAIKVLHAEGADKEAVERFFKEARAASAIEHPGIVKVYDVGENADGSFLVMELLEGESLEDRLLAQDKLDVQVAARFAVQIASALKAAHENGIVHRDLKPGNLFITRDPEVSGGERIKILDFGIAKVLAQGADPNVSQTRSDMLLGSPTYMSPEQCRGAEKVDQRADLYSLGCILFELLCGRPPFDQQVVAAVIAAHLRQEPPAPTSLRPEISPELERVVLRLLAKDADERYQSADEFIQAIVHGVGHSLVIEGSNRTLINATRLLTTMVATPKRRWLSGLAMLGLVAAVVAGIFALSRGDEPGPEVASAEMVAPEVPEPAVAAYLPPASRPAMRVKMLQAGDDVAAATGAGQRTELVIQGADTVEVALVSWRIDSEPPGARVLYNDGTPVHEGAVTPLVLEFPAVSGAENLRLQLDRHEEERVAVRFDAALDTRVEIQPIRVITLRTAPEGGVVLNAAGKELGPTPWTTDAPRASEPYTVTIRLEGYEDYQQVVGARAKVPEVIELAELRTVTLDTRPSGAAVIENGQEVGATPYTTGVPSKAKARALTLRLEGYEDHDLVVDPAGDLRALARAVRLDPVPLVEVRSKPKKATIRDAEGNEYSAPHRFPVSRKSQPRTLVISDPKGDYEDGTVTIGPDDTSGLRKGKTAKIEVKLARIPVFKVDSKPSKADVVGADGQSLGSTPMRFKMPSNQPTMALTLRSPGYQDLALVLDRAQSPPKRYTLERVPTMTLESSPRKATVYDEGGAELGHTPLLVSFDKDQKTRTLSVRMNGYKDAQVVLEYAKGRSKSKYKVELVSDTNTVTVSSEPSRVDVYDSRGKKLGRTPFELALARNDGARELVLRKSGYLDARVSLRPDQPAPARVELTRIITLKVESKPAGATVYGASGEKLGATPYVAQVERSGESLTYRLEREGYESATVTLTPTRDRKERVTLTPVPTDVTIEIVSEPAGASVMVGNRVLGQTPFKLTQMEASGRTEYTLVLEGHRKARVKLQNDESRREVLKLEKCDKPDPDALMTGIVSPYECDDRND